MRTLGKTILAILFAIALIQLWVIIGAHKQFTFNATGWFLLSVVAAAIYFFVFEYRRKK